MKRSGFPAIPMSTVRKGISAFLITFSFVWLAKIMYEDQEAIAQTFSHFQLNDIFFLLASIVIGSFANGLVFFVFEKMLSRHSEKPFDLSRLAFIFYSGQVIRYLPGRFFGIAYQINETAQKISPLTIIRTNIEFMLAIILFNSIACGSILIGHMYTPTYTMPLFIGGLFFFVIYLRFDWNNTILFRIRKMLPPRIAQGFKTPHHDTKCSYSFVFQIIAFLTGSLSLYIASWVLFKKIFPGFNSYQTIILFASYAIGWLIGFLSIVTPGGLGVREASFTLVCSKTLPHHSVAFLSIFLRLWLMIVDLLLFLISFGLLKISLRKNKETFPCEAPDIPA